MQDSNHNKRNEVTWAFELKRSKLEVTEEKNVRKCKVCGKAISKQDIEDFEDMCWECWDDQLTEESDSMYDELM